MSPRRVLLDVTQYAGHPVTSGVQRTLWQLTQHWQGHTIEAWCGVQVGDEVVVVAPADVADVIGRVFASEEPHDDVRAHAAAVLADLRRRCELTIPRHDLDVYFDAFLLPEPTYRADVLSTAASLIDHPTVTTFALVYDAIPQTAPWPFRGGQQVGTSPYFRLLGRVEHVACISQSAATVWHERIRRAEGGDAVVIRPGADGFAPGLATAPGVPTFVVVGTIEPRKRYATVVDAAEALWSAGHPLHLTLFGRPLDSESPAFLARLRAIAQRQPLLQWHHAANDSDLRSALLGATAMVFVSAHEGYGLPPLEALALGVPVIVAGDLPSLEGLPALGQIRLAEVTADSLAGALREASDPQVQRRLREEATRLTLPTWRDFAAEVEHWIHDRLERPVPSLAPDGSGPSRGAA